MRRLSTYIEYLLMSRHYVFVPGIGGFLLRDIDASYSNHKYTPSHREIHFNRFLAKDDGMLATAYMQMEGLTYHQAIAQIRFEVANIISALEEKKKYELGSLGTLSFDSDHYLTIDNPKQYPLDPDCYGLGTLSLKSWKDVEESRQKTEEKKSDAEVVSIPKYWVRRVAVIALILLCFFGNINTEENGSKIDYAAMFDTEILFGNATPNTLTEESWDNTWESESVLAEIEKQTEMLESKTEIEETPTIEESPATEEEPIISKTPEKLYYIIIGSTTSQEEAERILNKRKNEGYDNIGILNMDGRYRLYLKSFANRSEGESYLHDVRSNTPFQKAWLLPVQQESLLSYYLKNIDNDQLPMELSHPYQRTERDQGWINT